MKNTPRTIILKLTNAGVFYNENDFFLWKSTNFPSRDFFLFTQSHEVIWEVEMLKFDKNSATLFVRPLDYQCKRFEDFKLQNPKTPIRNLHFEGIIWTNLKKDLSYYSSQEFDAITIQEEPLKRKMRKFIEEDFSSLPISFDIPIKKVSFKLGYVEMEKKIRGLKEPALIKIHNDFILPEFEHIKAYFSKIFKKRKINVSGKLILHENGEIESHCYSEEISSINEKMLSTIRQLKIKEVIKKPPVITIDKSLLTNEDFFQGLN